ncbi:MAG: hypothetical protein AABW81_01110 [Nanoarchaeota archaeon]
MVNFLKKEDNNFEYYIFEFLRNTITDMYSKAEERREINSNIFKGIIETDNKFYVEGQKYFITGKSNKRKIDDIFFLQDELKVDESKRW